MFVHPSHHGLNFRFSFMINGQNIPVERGEHAGVKRGAILLVRVNEADSSAR
jgi:hypothetical protein